MKTNLKQFYLALQIHQTISQNLGQVKLSAKSLCLVFDISSTIFILIS